MARAEPCTVAAIPPRMMTSTFNPARVVMRARTSAPPRVVIGRRARRGRRSRLREEPYEPLQTLDAFGRYEAAESAQ